MKGLGFGPEGGAGEQSMDKRDDTVHGGGERNHETGDLDGYEEDASLEWQRT